MPRIQLRHCRRPGLSLIEVLVVFGIIGLLIGLVVPAVQQARESASRASCQNRLHQIALGLHGYHDAQGAFPIGLDRSPYGIGNGSLEGVSWRAKILPFIDQDALSLQTVAALTQDPFPWQYPPHVGLVTVLAVYGCPSDARVDQLHDGPDGILAAYGSFLGVEGEHPGSSNGVFPVGYAVRMAEITDGTSSTIMVGERPPSVRLDSGWWYCPHLVFLDESRRIAGYYAHDSILSAVMGKETSNCSPPPSGLFVFGPGRLTNECDMYHFWSLHTGGANFAFADGSVRFLSYSISPLLPQLASRNGGEVVTPP